MAATFPAALMWRGLVNNVTLATTTHRKMGEMPDEMGEYSNEGPDDQQV